MHASNRSLHWESCDHFWLSVKQGFLDSQNVATSIDELDEYSDFERPARSDKHTRRSVGNQKFNSRKSKTNDDWDLPMDYF